MVKLLDSLSLKKPSNNLMESEKDVIYKDGMKDEQPEEVQIEVPTTGDSSATQPVIPQEMAENGRFSSLLSRKFIISLVVLLLATWLFSIGDISVSDWKALVTITTCTYLGVNVIQKFTS